VRGLLCECGRAEGALSERAIDGHQHAANGPANVGEIATVTRALEKYLTDPDEQQHDRSRPGERRAEASRQRAGHEAGDQHGQREPTGWGSSSALKRDGQAIGRKRSASQSPRSLAGG